MNNHSTVARLRVALVALAALLAAGCVAPTAGPTTPRVAPTFDYTPAANAEPMSANITFAVVGSSFFVGSRTETDHTPVPLFERFSSSMAHDFAEILTARGFTIRGPFATYDEMTFPDKENSNLVLSATVNLTPDMSGLEGVELATLSDTIGGTLDILLGTSGRATSDGGGGRYKVKGTVRLEGRVTIVVAESLTNEKMWTKSVDIEPITVALDGERVFAVPPSGLAEVLEHENQFYTDLGRALAGRYVEIMERTHAYLDPREMALVDRQADTLRERKRY